MQELAPWSKCFINKMGILAAVAFEIWPVHRIAQKLRKTALSD
jgi:hypothetical protein